MGCRTHSWKSQSTEPSISGLKMNLGVKSAKSEDVTTMKGGLPEYQYVNSDSDTSDSNGDMWSMRNMIIESQMVRCGPRDEYASGKSSSQSDKRFQKMEFRLPKLEFTDLMVSIAIIRLEFILAF